MANKKKKQKNILKAGLAGFFFMLALNACFTKQKAMLANTNQNTEPVLENNFLKTVPKIVAEPENGILTLGTDTIYTKDHYLGDTIEAVFYFTVVKEPLKILQVHPGCQCTAPVYPKDTLQPGNIDSIVLVFYTKKVHPGNFVKYAYVLNPIKEVDYFIIGKVKELPKGIKPRKIKYTNR